MRVDVTTDAVGFISQHGGQLFVWPTEHRSFRLSLTLLEASTEPPEEALSFQRFAAPGFLLFLHPRVRTLPEFLQVEIRGRRYPHIEVYWEGLGYVM